MAEITLKGTPVHTVGDLPPVGSKVPDFRLTKSDLTDVTLEDFKGYKKILNITSSLDTRVCAASARNFNEKIKGFSDSVVLNVSNDTPFAQDRVCESNNIDSVITLAQLRNRDFGRDYGVALVDGPFEGLLARAVIVLNKDNTVLYHELVPEISHEPDYERALAALRS